MPMELDRYLERASPIHAADARLKFLVTIGFILSLSLLPVGSFVAIGLAWAALIVVTLAARIGPARVIKASFVALPFVAAAVPLIFTKEGDPIGDINFGLFTLTASGEGLTQFATILLKSWVSVQAAVLLTFSTRFPDLVEALRALRVPAIIVAVISFMYRYLAVLTDEATRMMRARASRSGSADGSGGGSVIWRAKVVGSMVGSLFIRAYERSERIYAAMQSRGFDGTMRTLRRSRFAGAQWIALIVAAVTLCAFEVTGHLWLPRA
jgi:cobalt/nickel transport system permease protein